MRVFLISLLFGYSACLIPSQFSSVRLSSKNHAEKSFLKSFKLRFSPEDLSIQAYDLQLRISDTLGSLAEPSPISSALLVLGGTLTSLSPCALGLLPITLSYLRGNSVSSTSPSAANSYILKLFAYTGGIVTAFTTLGLGAGVLGSVLAPVASQAALLKYILVNSLYIFLGLSLLELSPVRIDQSLMSKVFKVQRTDGYLGAYLYGISSALLGTNAL